MIRKKSIRLAGGKSSRLLLAVLLILGSLQPVFAQSSQPSTEDQHGKFGGPDLVPKRIEADLAAPDTLYEFEFMKPYYDMKDWLYEKTGYLYQMDYFPVYLKASDSLPGMDDDAAGAVFRFSGFWELLGHGTDSTGTLVYLVEHRHAYKNNSVSPFGLENLGYAGFSGIPFTDDGWWLTNLFWNQEWQNGFGFAAGFLDVTDWVDVYAQTSPWTDFHNYAFSIGAGTFDLPDDASLGFAAGGWLIDNVYLIAGFEDLNSDPTNPWKGFDTFYNDREYFKHIEVGWTMSGQEQYYQDNLHLTMWQTDERKEIGVKDGWGAFLSFSHTIGRQWLMFTRGGFAEDGGSLLEKSVSVGGGYAPNGIGAPGSGHQLGFGANWGKPNDALFGTDLDDQYALEVYYRLQVTRELAITPDVQLLIDPSLNPDEDQIWVGGVRMRVAF